MAEAPDIHSGGDSPEMVAYTLLKHVAAVEARSLTTKSATNPSGKKWILDTYAECLLAVKNPDARK